MDIPKNLSDSWLEKEYDALSRSLTSGYAVLNFEKVVWVELSALINLTAIIIKHKEKLKRLDFLFDAFNRAIGSKESLRFLLESHFYLAIESSIKDDDILFYIWFKTPSDKADDALNLKNKFLYYLQGDVASEDEDPVTIHKNKFGKIFIALDVKKLRKGRRVDASFFSIFGYQVWHPRDSFIVPITHICNEEIPKYLQFDLENPPQKTLVDDLQLGINVFPEKTKTILDELNQLWLYEFIHNAFEHGEKNVIFCARLGSWEVRQKFTKNLNIDGEGYLYRKKFLKRQPHRGLDLYIDLYVVDFGKGFISLKDAYERENGPLKGKHKIKKLHRYSLFHHSSRKHLNRIEDSIYSTGLGMISEQIVTNDAMLSIKDKEALTYFEKQSIERLSDQGATEILSTSDFGFTSISAILPIPDDAWLSRNRVISFDTNDGYIDKIIIIKSPVNESVFPDKCILVGNNYSGKYEILKEVPLGKIDLLGKWPIVFDMVNSRPTYKYMASRIVDKFFEWRKLGNPFFGLFRRICG
jgi:hypothetical protein